jgi:Tfp pilus assembly protein PilW
MMGLPKSGDKETYLMKKAIVLAVAALALPSVALAKPPSTHTNHSKAAPKVMYVLKGTLSAYTPAASATQDGTITILVSHSNYHGRALKGQSLQFPVSMKTRVTYQNGTTAATISGTLSAKGMVKFRAPLRVAGGNGALAATLPTLAKAFHVIVNHPKS